MNAERSFAFPEGIDEPPMLLFWEIPQFILGMAFIVVGVILRDPLAMAGCVIASMYTLKFFKRYQTRAKRNEMRHSAYSIGMPGDKVLSRWPSTYKDFCGG